MSEMYHSEPFQCGDPAGLISYLYDECEPGAREVIATHVATCFMCAEELSSLGATRTQLASWVPPDAAIGFQITKTSRVTDATSDSERVSERDNVLRPARWWSRPLPAWAQMAAAVLLFASGMAIGVSRTGAPPETTATVNAPAPVVAQPVAAIGPTEGVTPGDLQALEQRLRGEIAQARTTTVAAPVSRAADADMFKRVQALITDSEQRQRRELALRTTEIVRDMDTQRRVDLAQVQRNLGQIQDLTGAAVRDQNDMFNYLVKVSQRPR
jgi:anti-sigma factor RsiW